MSPRGTESWPWRSAETIEADRRALPGYGRRAKRVLFLSATPIEGSYQQLWNQFDVFGLGGPFAELKRRDATDEEKKADGVTVPGSPGDDDAGQWRELTKNQYRREWRQGGVLEHDEPITVTDPRKRLVVALVQKKVASCWDRASSTCRSRSACWPRSRAFCRRASCGGTMKTGNFDDPEQTRDLSDAVKEGLDVRDVNRLARNYFNRFQEHMPHPKMDEVVESLATSWLTGKKTLVFVRRVASVKELEQKLDERYDKWLIPFLRENLPQEVTGAFDSACGSLPRGKAGG